MDKPQAIRVRVFLILLALGACTSAQSARSEAPPPPTPSPTVTSVLALPERIQAAVLPQPPPQDPPKPPELAPFVVRGMYGRDSSATGVNKISAAGFNTVTVQPDRADLDAFRRAGMKGIVWLWGYDDDTCTFNHSDDQIRAEVARIAGHQAIYAYQIAAEPGRARTEGCSRVASQIRDRARLVKSIDPAAVTYLVVSTYDGVEEYPYQHFAGTTDIMGLDVYPYNEDGTHPEMIGNAIREADKDRVPRYWAILQDFADDYYVVPSAAQLREQFTLWRRSRMEGYFVYHWEHGNIENRSSHLRIYASENERPVRSQA